MKKDSIKNNFVQATRELFLDDSAQANNEATSEGMETMSVDSANNSSNAVAYDAKPEESNNGFPSARNDDSPSGVGNRERRSTLIAEGTVIRGSIFTEGHVEVLGRVEGDVSAQGDVRVEGHVFGNITGDCVELIATQLRGNLTATNRVHINKDSVIVGDIHTNTIDFDGKMKGEIDAKGAANINSDSYLAGNVSAQTVSIQSGASINGIVETKLGKIDNAKAFDFE